MYRSALFSLLLVTSVHSQLNGEFWWLNSKLNSLKKVQPDSPKIETSDFKNDEIEKLSESARIMFRDDDLFTNKVLKPILDRTSKLPVVNSEHKIVWPKEEHMKSHDVEVFSTKNSVNEEIKTNKVQANKYKDILVFSYPRYEKIDTTDATMTSTELNHSTSTENLVSKTETKSTSTDFLLSVSKLPIILTTYKATESQNICTYTKKNKCVQLSGFVYEYARRIPATTDGEPLVCCILPIKPLYNNENTSHTIYFPHSSSNLNRFKRSDFEENIALKQRDFLLKRKFPSQQQKTKPVSTPLTKIVTPPEDEYVDPYWNVKNTKFQISPKPSVESAKYDYYSEDYKQEYTDELPKPGLVGLYSDHAASPSNSHYGGSNTGFYIDSDDDEDDYEDTFGYSTMSSVDPRLGEKKKIHTHKPQKLTTTSGEDYDAERHTISFQSNPDFHVFQGFKLLNLFRNTSRFHSAITKRTINQDDEPLVATPDYSEETGEFFEGNQLFNGCGKAKKGNDKINQIGEAANGSHPWMMLVVLTKRRHNIICYATLVHPRAAITVADCVQGTSPRDVSVIAGLWDLNERSHSRNRVTTVHVHPRYQPGDAENNLAILYWMRPFVLGVNVQPACLGEPQIGDECKFFGWGGLDQGLQQHRSRWQRVSIRACTGRQTTDSFCVSALRETVTGMGGPLICDVNGHSTIVGAVVSRNHGIVLVPVRDWTMKAEDLLNSY